MEVKKTDCINQQIKLMNLIPSCKKYRTRKKLWARLKRLEAKQWKIIRQQSKWKYWL